jgi:hypothetical protein
MRFHPSHDRPIRVENPATRRARRWPAIALVVVAWASVASEGWAKPARLVSITLEPSGDKLSILPGDEQKIRAVATYSDKTTEDVTERLVYASSKPEIVTVAGPGLARAVKGGDAEVSAYDPVSQKSARTTVKFKVAKLSRIDVAPPGKVVPVGRALPVRAIGTYDNGRAGVDITARVTWSSDKPGVARIGVDPGGSPVIEGVAAGKTKILAFEPLDRVKSDGDSSKVTVVAKLAALAIDPASVALRNGQQASLRALGTFEGGAVADLTPYVEWSSSDPSVAVVDAGGALSAVGMGRAMVDVREPKSGVASSSGAATVDVLGGLLALAVAPSNATLPVGASARLAPFAIYEGRDEPLRLSSGVTWKSSNATVAITVAPDGVDARCVTAGSATVSFFDTETALGSTGFAGDARVACVADVPTVRVSPAKKLLAQGKSTTLGAFLLLPDGTERDITLGATWTSSRPDVVTITRSGDLVRARGVAPGVAVVTAVDPVTGTGSADPLGVNGKLSVPGAPKTLKIFPAPTSSSGIELTNGVPFLLKARVDFEGGANQGANNLVLWTSSDASVLRLSNGEDGRQPGTATPLRTGEVTVTIQYPKPGGPTPQFPPAQPMSRSVKIRIR